MSDFLDSMAVISTLVGAVALAAGAFIYRTAPDPRVGTRFGLLLALETAMVWTSPVGPLHWLEPEGHSSFWLRVHIANDGLLLATYLPALAVTIRASWLSPFQPRGVALALLILGLLNAIFVFTLPDLYLGGGDRVFHYLGAGIEPGLVGALWIAILALLIGSYGYGLIVTLIARHSARGPVLRRKATILALAFGVRDLTWGLMYATVLFSAVFGRPELLADPTSRMMFFAFVVGGLAIYIALTAYGIASSDLFDIDLKVKWTLERGTLGAIFVAVFFMVSEGASTVLSDQLGTWIGILATGALVFALAPLQSVVEKLSDQAMPSVQDTPEYRSFRKLQIYAEAFREAMSDGEISPVERVVLNRLRAQLELTQTETEAFERDLDGSRSTGPAAA